MSDGVGIEVRPPLFGTSGIRGVVGDTITIQFCWDIARAIGSTIEPHARVCIATDARTSRDMLKPPLIMGLMSAGVDVTDMGLLPTPLLAFATRELGCAAGIVVTASHNPPEYNGIKLFNGDGAGYTPEQEKRVEDTYYQKRFRTGVVATPTVDSGTEERYFQFVKRLLGKTRFPAGIRLVVDPGNGAASGYAGRLFARLGLSVIPVNDTPDGRFPGRSPEPRDDTLTGTHRFLLEQNADLAACFDGDADRVVFLDRQGFIGFDEAVTFVAAQAVKKSGKKKVAATIEAGRMMDSALAPLGVEVVRGRVGDVHVAHLARRLDAAIGVETVGVYIFPRAGFYPDSLLAVLTLLHGLKHPGDVRGFFANVPRYLRGQRRIPCANQDKPAVMQKVMARPSRFGDGVVNNIDGLRMEFPDGWLLVRPSGTEPIIRIIAESTTQAETERLLSVAEAVVRDIMKGLA